MTAPPHLPPPCRHVVVFDGFALDLAAHVLRCGSALPDVCPLCAEALARGLVPERSVA